ncbi:PREDICTED: acidic leucine-rich nuclear phosphoprotein 32 family member A isoform X1 [Rhagoletis zephyria]|uniref:acidic leucine-rich nuclear phosphoprotein 32 family member A isoform X1 n=1 Tax=Rhagoletis zephyria TaxID=28612 RepID=UPI0008116BFF|nr:PREDICTED: acidic leucine-rich nuclear phosphoprotein 32 family member A isoform X1 [Rhagoletis zephyria]XP_017466946.1 PREDICTED: acidic leucine-rich nuclear phosphoprotein 32 family member A isoform X1 [Rhagoletis zephyria]XP_036331976.1 acidic leucine-rich nuclear phosphoprotein 32 family member A isoform X1 [Rhagoletis pomonella]XP_036331977.1 acidic leucine-rich nuclear phosphoprotein 32 family member A isoform X1 [Rhagoletis pomonella]
MEKRIELERRARKANQITELNLDNCRSTSIVGLTDEYTALESLSLINVGLTTLKGFPKLPNLKKLELSDNRISNGLNYLTTSPKLQYLNLSGNKIKDLETLKPLEEFKHLAVLDLFNNEATQIENYREKIFEMLKSLKFLDGFDANDVEAPSEGDDDDEVNGNDDGDEEDSCDEEDYGSSYVSTSDVSLSEVYNEDLEEDNSEWDEENAVEDDDEDTDEDDSDGDGDGEGNVSSAKAAAGKEKSSSNSAAAKAADAAEADNKDAAEEAGEEETQARGKKRKHDG